MKANEAPEKLYFGRHEGSLLDTYSKKEAEDEIEYVRTDAFIEKACKKLEKCMYDNLMFQGRLHRKEVIETFIEDFKKYLEGKDDGTQTKFMGSYTTTTETDNGKKYKDYRKDK